MSRDWQAFPHVGLGARTSAGQATAGIFCAEYRSGQLIIYCPTLAGTLVPYWQSSADGVHWGDLARGATMSATGVRVIAVSGGIGHWARTRWVGTATATFKCDFLFTT
jgi:hypothetical protein